MLSCMNACRDAGLKAARVTVLEMKVLTHMRRECFELRERINRRKIEMEGKLQQLGYGGSFVSVLHCLPVRVAHGLY